MRPGPSAANLQPVGPDLICTASARTCWVCVLCENKSEVFFITAYESPGALSHRCTAQHLLRFAAFVCFESSYSEIFGLKTWLLLASSALVCSLFVLSTGHWTGSLRTCIQIHTCSNSHGNYSKWMISWLEPSNSSSVHGFDNLRRKPRNMTRIWEMMSYLGGFLLTLTVKSSVQHLNLQCSHCEMLMWFLISGGAFIVDGRHGARWADSPACEESASEAWMWGEQLRAGQRALGKRAQTPVLSERLLCRAEQVSAEQLSSSLQQNTLTSIHRGSVDSVKVIAPFARSSFPAFFFPTSAESSLPCQRSSVFLSSAGLFTVAGL